MNLLKRYIVVTLCTLSTLVSSAVAFAQSQQTTATVSEITIYNGSKDDVAQIEQVIKNYAQSIDNIDIKLAEKIWQTNKQTTFIHPRGNEVGWDAIKNNFYKEVMGHTFSKRQLNIHNINLQVYGDFAVAVFNWDFPAIFREDGTPITTYGRESQIYKKTGKGWKIVHVHYSKMPITESKQGF